MGLSYVSPIQIYGSLCLAIRRVAVSSLLDEMDYTVLADSEAGDITITLPAEPMRGRLYRVCKISSHNRVVIERNGKLIEGMANNLALQGNLNAVGLQFEPSYGWKVL